MITGEESNCNVTSFTYVDGDSCEEKITSIRRGEVFKKYVCVCVYVCKCVLIRFNCSSMIPRRAEMTIRRRHRPVDRSKLLILHSVISWYLLLFFFLLASRAIVVESGGNSSNSNSNDSRWPTVSGT